MNADWEKDYPLLSDLSEINLDDNSSLKKMLDLIGENKCVIDFGCATGYFARLLSDRGCKVVGVEVNSKAAKIAEKYCEEVIITDLDFVSLNNILSEQISPGKFDVAIFGDILEHLRNPWKILKETRDILKDEGYVVASIPNIAHGAVRLALLQGNFEYKPLGILDNTHLRFFTRTTAEQLFDDSGYLIDIIERTKLPIYSHSDLIPAINKNSFDPNITNKVEQDEDADTLQFVIRGYPVSLENKYSTLKKEYSLVCEQFKYSETQLKNIIRELHQSKIELQTKNNELQKLVSKLKYTETNLEQERNSLQQIRLDFKTLKIQLEKHQEELEERKIKLDQIQQQWEDNQIQLQEAHDGWEHCQQIIQAMETSKFWKLRGAWFQVKQSLGLKVK